MSIKNSISENEEWGVFEYLISVTIVCDKLTATLNENQILGLYIEKNYDNDHLPIMLLDISIKEDFYEKIRLNADKTEFKLVIRKYSIDQEEEDSENSAVKKNQGIYLQDSFIPIMPKQTPIGNRVKSKDTESIESEEDITSVDEHSLGNSYRFVLVKREIYVKSKTITNLVIQSSDITYATCLALNDAKVKNVLMSNLDNTKIYKEILLFPIPLLSQLIYLDSYFGFYKQGTVIFYDNDCLYIVRKTGVCSAWRKNERKKVTFCINSASSADDKCRGTLLNGGYVYMNIGSDQYHIGDGSDIIDQTTGTNMMIVNEDTGEFNQVSSGVQSVFGNGTNVQSYPGHNPYISNIYKKRKQELKHTITLVCTNCDISYFTPNKSYTVITDVSSIIDDVKGNYRLSRIMTKFVKEGRHFNDISTITIKRAGID